MEKKNKKCTKCGEVKTSDEFSKDRHRKDGKRSRCKPCESALSREYHHKNRDACLKRMRMYAKEHKEELRIKNQERYYKDRENRLTYAKKRHRTKRGFLLNAYSNAKGRVTGRKLRSAIKQGNPVGSLEQYVGLPIMEKEEFLNWATKDKMFNKIFEEWEKGGYKLVDSPSIDRLNTQDGYVMGNIFFSTHSENSRAGSISRWQQ